MKVVQFCMVNGCGLEAEETVRLELRGEGTAILHLCGDHARRELLRDKKGQRRYYIGRYEPAQRRP
jgi:hypothetical protein